MRSKRSTGAKTPSSTATLDDAHTGASDAAESPARYPIGMFSAAEARCDRWHQLAHAAQTLEASSGAAAQETLAEAQSLLIRLDLRGFAVSAGSACSSGTPEPSKVLLAMGLPVDEARASVRISFGPVNTAADVDAFLAALGEEVAALRGAAIGAPLLL